MCIAHEAITALEKESEMSFKRIHFTPVHYIYVK